MTFRVVCKHIQRGKGMHETERRLVWLECTKAKGKKVGGTERQARANSEEHQRPHFKLECDVIISSSGGSAQKSNQWWASRKTNDTVIEIIQARRNAGTRVMIPQYEKTWVGRENVENKNYQIFSVWASVWKRKTRKALRFMLILWLKQMSEL